MIQDTTFLTLPSLSAILAEASSRRAYCLTVVSESQSFSSLVQTHGDQCAHTIPNARRKAYGALTSYTSHDGHDNIVIALQVAVMQQGSDRYCIPLARTYRYAPPMPEHTLPRRCQPTISETRALQVPRSRMFSSLHRLLHVLLLIL